MSRSTSPATGKRYGVKRACEILGWPRSSFYSSRIKKTKPGRKRGPKPTWSDRELMDFINHDLTRSPFEGEGHRKVWARLRVIDGVRVSRKRVLRIMRENDLLSPYRSRQGQADEHQGTIITDAPNVMWGTDGSRILTQDEGWVWIFVAVEHWNSECIGWHVSKPGTRFQALEPISMALTDIYGGVDRAIARGLQLRMDHGSQYLSDHFQNQIKAWGLAPSYAFVSQPQTNGVAERFFRTLKEQAIYGRVFRNAEEVRQAVNDFVETYNHSWRLERLGYMSPIELRKSYLTRDAA
jgi:putative transposase